MDKRLSPKDFLKRRRPELFSDSVHRDRSAIDRTLLEFNLSSITSRSDEILFEKFARQLAAREICPNLLPHTGPTGGGDSKVDSETFPVADDLALTWYSAVGREAAKERWAFAMSAQKKWQTKVKSDVAKITKTDRGYTNAFFITNQAVPDKKRAVIEDELSKKYGIDVRILDRTWILDRVFEHNHTELAVKELGMQVPRQSEVQKGLHDIERERELEALEERIKSAPVEGRLNAGFIADCLEAAKISRNLEHSRIVVDGRFERAALAAQKCRSKHHRLLVAYEKAWTGYWFYEDYLLLAKLYGEVEKLAKGTSNIYELELLNNLWTVMRTAVLTGNLSAKDAKLKRRTTQLMRELKRLAADIGRLSTSLQARTFLLHNELLLEGQEHADSVFGELAEVAKECGGLVGYAFESFARLIKELGAYFGDRAAYDHLFETVVKIASEREGEVEGARMLLDRGLQHLKGDRPYEAIRILGRTFANLYKDETRKELVRALLLCARAYERVGLLWAARGATIIAASIATDHFWTHSEIIRPQAATYECMKWLELRLGRIPQVLAWYELDMTVRHGLKLPEGDTPDFFDPIFGMLLLRADVDQLDKLSTLPDILDTMQLFMAAEALRYGLGHNIDLPKDLTGESVEDFFRKWCDQPAAKDLPSDVALYDGETSTLTSSVLGCQFTVETVNRHACVQLGESILAAIESLFATAIEDRVIAHQPSASISIDDASAAEEPFSFEVIERNGRPHFAVHCAGFVPHDLSREMQATVKDKLSELVLRLAGTVFMIGNPEETLTKLFRDEQAVVRAINFTSSFVATYNILGKSPKTTLSDWLEPKAKEYRRKRSTKWDAGDPIQRPERTKQFSRDGARHSSLHGAEDLIGLTHKDIQTVSLIREPLWVRAKWFATVFTYALNDGEPCPPGLALAFKDAAVAREIFALLRTDLGGSKDIQEKLRITIIRGIEKNEPFAYRVVIGANMPMGLDASKVSLVARVHTMHPTSDDNLRRFLEEYEKHGCFFFMAACWNDGRQPELIFDTDILVRQIHIREAWQIGRHDQEACVIREDDNPIIPAGTTNAPITELLAWLKDRSTVTALQD